MDWANTRGKRWLRGGQEEPFSLLFFFFLRGAGGSERRSTGRSAMFRTVAEAGDGQAVQELVALRARGTPARRSAAKRSSGWPQNGQVSAYAAEITSGIENDPDTGTSRSAAVFALRPSCRKGRKGSRLPSSKPSRRSNKRLPAGAQAKAMFWTWESKGSGERWISSAEHSREVIEGSGSRGVRRAGTFGGSSQGRPFNDPRWARRQRRGLGARRTEESRSPTSRPAGVSKHESRSTSASVTPTAPSSSSSWPGPPSA